MLIFLLYLVLAPLTCLTLLKISSRWHKYSRIVFLFINALLTIFAVFTALRVALRADDPATPAGIRNGLSMSLALLMVVLPTFMLLALHYAGVLVKIRKGGYLRSLTGTALALWGVVLLLCLGGTLIGRNNITTERVEISIPSLRSDLEGFTIVHISDLHLGGFYRREKRILETADIINGLKPDIIVNTGDFITLGHLEFGRFDTLLATMRSRYGNFAILGNHDSGTYLHGADAHMTMMTTWLVSDLIEASGYTLLNRCNIILSVGNSRVAIIGAETGGKHPDIVHPDLTEAVKGTIDADLRILLTHDPNHWEEVTEDYPGIELTLAGHTHGMQIGYIGRKRKWSPSQYSYQRWHGLYRKEDMQLYVNRGLGVIGLPLRIGMPPEITVITLRGE